MSIKLSKRDRVFILILIVLIVLGVGIFTMVKPKMEEAKVVKERLTAKQQEWDAFEARLATLDSLKKTLNDKIDAVVEEQKTFLTEADYGETFQIDQYLTEILAPSEITIVGIGVDLVAPTTLDEYFYNLRAIAYPLKIDSDIGNKLPAEVYYAYDDKWPDGQPGVDVAVSQVTISYRSDLELQQLFAAIDAIADHDKSKSIYLNTVSADYAKIEDSQKADGSAEVVDYAQGDIVLTVYEITPMNKDDIK